MISFFFFFQNERRIKWNSVSQDWITFPSGSISRNDYIEAKMKSFAWLVAGQPCRKLREFRRYLSPGPMILSSIICIPVFYPDPNYLQTFYRDLHAFWIRTCRSIEFKFAFRYGLLFLDQPPPFSCSYFSEFFQGKRSLPSLLPFYTLWGRRWDNRRHRLSSTQFIEACFNVKTHPCWLASFKLYVPPFKSGGGFYVWPELSPIGFTTESGDKSIDTMTMRWPKTWRNFCPACVRLWYSVCAILLSRWISKIMVDSYVF